MKLLWMPRTRKERRFIEWYLPCIYLTGSLFSKGTARYPKTRISDITSSKPRSLPTTRWFQNRQIHLSQHWVITAIKHMEVFSLVTITAILLCPGTEREHLGLLLSSKLWLLYCGPLKQLNFGSNQGLLTLALHSIVIIFSICPSLVSFIGTNNIVYE